jgi:hypothetical protein
MILIFNAQMQKIDDWEIGTYRLSPEWLDNFVDIILVVPTTFLKGFQTTGWSEIPLCSL